jgi:hypothetical protein
MPETSTPDDAEIYGPPAPLRLFTWTYRDPSGRQHTLDTAGITRHDAFPRAVRFLRQERRRWAAAGVPAKRNIRLPRAAEQLCLVLPAWVYAEGRA